MKLYARFKIRASISYFLLILVLPWILNLFKADFVPCKKFIFSVILGFFVANVRTVLKLKYIWDKKEVRTIRGLLPIYLINYPITVVVICIIGSYIFNQILQLPKTISLLILFCLGFAVDSIFYLITHPGDLFQRLS